MEEFKKSIKAGLCLIYLILIWGFITKQYWQWFILPIFTTLPQITFYQAIGLSFFIGLFKTLSYENIGKESTNKMYMYAIVTPLLILFCGWIVSLIIL